jgi:hypothetical protein
MTLGRWLILGGAALLLLGVLVQLGLPLGRLPGDLRWSRGGVSFYAPLATAIVLSLVATVILNLIARR